MIVYHRKWRKDEAFIYSPERNFIGIVEDEVELAYLFKEALSAKGYVVTVFTDPIVAPESICTEHSRYRLVLSDVKMSKLDGIELVKRIHEKRH